MRAGHERRMILSILLKSYRLVVDTHRSTTQTNACISTNSSPIATMANKNPTVIDISSGDEDEELKKAIALSLETGEAACSGQGTPCKRSEPLAQPVAGLAGLDRRKMEEERLARVKKRQLESPQQETPPKRLQTVAAKTNEAPLRFPQPVVKRTWAFGYPRMGDDVKIEEIFDKKHLQLALLSSFTWDEDWLLTKVDIRTTRLMLLAFANDEETVPITHGKSVEQC